MKKFNRCCNLRNGFQSLVQWSLACHFIFKVADDVEWHNQMQMVVANKRLKQLSKWAQSRDVLKNLQLKNC